MSDLNSSTGPLIQANIKIAYGILLAGVGYLIWPSDVHWYAFYAFSVVMYLSALICVGQAIKIFHTVHYNDGLRDEILARGKQAHNAKIMDDNDLKNDGMME
ncbi:hypothetical protein [Maritalea sp.]|jgi:hypothetical protein|uniref:hypothetical protein n=1 Tax=Maritalea sp. TaxID=2003361 RepID=UPI0039E3EA75